MPRGLRIVIPLAIILAVFSAISFFSGRALFSDSDAAEALAPPPATPREERTRLIREDQAKPRFDGELNGFTFFVVGRGFDTRALQRAMSPKCTGFNSRNVDRKEANSSRLNFTATYLPTGAQESTRAVNACEDEVIAI